MLLEEQNQVCLSTGQLGVWRVRVAAQLKAAVVHRGCCPQCQQSGDAFQAGTWKKFICVIMTSLREKVLKVMTSRDFLLIAQSASGDQRSSSIQVNFQR